jgi:hypothetical protein
MPCIESWTVSSLSFLNCIHGPAVEDAVCSIVWGAHWTQSFPGHLGIAIIQVWRRDKSPGVCLLVLRPISTPEGDVLTTSNSFLLVWGLCRNVTAMGPQEQFLNTQRHTWYPVHPAEEEEWPHSLGNTLSLTLFPFHICCQSYAFQYPVFCALSSLLPPKRQDQEANYLLNV